MIKDLFLLNPDITFLNHGSFGACPKPIFEDYQKWQLMLEKDPVQFVTETGPKHLEKSREILANYIHCNKDDLVYVPNPSTAINTIVKNLGLQEGDEILTTSQEYGAMTRTWRYYCKKTGAKYIEQPITLPLVSKEKFLIEFWKGLSPKTKIIFISQITSRTALIFPVKEICEKARELGLMTIIDGAHVPGHIPLNLSELDPDVYTGACHKWLMTPKGNSFLYVKKGLQQQIDPLVVSWGYDSENPSHSQFLDYHEYQGTRDISAFLTTASALSFFKENDWENRKEACRNELKHFYPIVAKELNSHILCPLSDEFLGQICSIPIQTIDPIHLKKTLYTDYKIEIPIMAFGDSVYLRISFQAYNGAKEIERLIDALREIKLKTNLLD